MQNPEPLELAAEFSIILRDALDPATVREIIAKNRTPAYAGSICASHDYCDANLIMAEAWEGLTGYETDVGDESQAHVWNLAWAAAKASEFNSQHNGE